MTTHMRSRALFGFAFIAGVFAISFLLTRDMTVSAVPQAPLPLDENTVLYLVDDGQIPADSYRHPDMLLQNLSSNISVVNNSEDAADALASANLDSLDVLIVDHSALEFTEPDDITAAFDASIVVVGFNIPVKQLSSLIDDSRIIQDGFATDPYPGDFFIYAFQEITGERPDEVARVRQAARRGTDLPIPGITRPISSQFSAGQNTLDTPTDLEIFIAVIHGRVIADR